MTEEQIEKAARALCRMLGVDPEDPGQTPSGMDVPVWQVFTDDIRRFHVLQQAIEEALKP